MATEAIQLSRESPEHIQSTVSSIQKMLTVGAVFAVVGYLLTGSALVLELTQFHPLLDDFFKWPSTLLWLKLGGIAHILLGIFVALAAIVRALALMPHRLSYEMERTQG